MGADRCWVPMWKLNLKGYPEEHLDRRKAEAQMAEHCRTCRSRCPESVFDDDPL